MAERNCKVPRRPRSGRAASGETPPDRPGGRGKGGPRSSAGGRKDLQRRSTTAAARSASSPLVRWKVIGAFVAGLAISNATADRIKQMGGAAHAVGSALETVAGVLGAKKSAP